MMDSWRHFKPSGEKFIIEERKIQYNIECFSFDRGNYAFRILKPNLTKLVNISILNSDKGRIYSIKYNKKTLKVTLVKKEDNSLYVIYDGHHLKINVLERFSSNYKGELTSGSLEAPVPGKVAKVYVKNNQKVKEDQNEDSKKDQNKNPADVDKNENKSSDSPEQQKIESNSNPDLSPEDRSKQQKLEQWLRKIPDDPGRLLRNKMKREYQRRDKKQIESKQYW